MSTFAHFLLDLFWNISNHTGRRRDTLSLLRAVEIDTSASLCHFFFYFFFYQACFSAQHQNINHKVAWRHLSVLKGLYCGGGVLTVNGVIDFGQSSFARRAKDLWMNGFRCIEYWCFNWMSCEMRQNRLHRSGQVGAACRRFLLLQCLFFASKKVFLPRQCGSSSAWPWTRQKPCFQPERLLDKNQFIAAILLRVKLWMCPRVTWYSFGGNTECCFKTTPSTTCSKSLFCFVYHFRSGPLLRRGSLLWNKYHSHTQNICLF